MAKKRAAEQPSKKPFKTVNVPPDTYHTLMTLVSELYRQGKIDRLSIAQAAEYAILDLAKRLGL